MERRLIIVLSVALGVALTVIAYLVGNRPDERMAAAPAPGSPNPPPASASADPGTAAVPTASTALTPLPATAAPPAGMSTLAPPAAPSAATVPPAASAGASPAADALLRPEVVRYFAQVDAIQAEAKAATGDPEALAQLILKHATDGDMTEFDTLLQAQRGLADRLRAVVPPAPCAEHLQKSVAAVDDGIAILQKTRDALVSHDFASLSTLTTVGQDLERRAHEVDALGAALKKRFAL
jgi:hypothetical protein